MLALACGSREEDFTLEMGWRLAARRSGHDARMAAMGLAAAVTGEIALLVEANGHVSVNFLVTTSYQSSFCSGLFMAGAGQLRRVRRRRSSLRLDLQSSETANVECISRIDRSHRRLSRSQRPPCGSPAMASAAARLGRRPALRASQSVVQGHSSLRRPL